MKNKNQTGAKVQQKQLAVNCRSIGRLICAESKEREIVRGIYSRYLMEGIIEVITADEDGVLKIKHCLLSTAQMEKIDADGETLLRRARWFNTCRRILENVGTGHRFRNDPEVIVAMDVVGSELARKLMEPKPKHDAMRRRLPGSLGHGRKH